MEIGDDLLLQFRAIAAERLHRIEAAWSDLLGSLDERAAAQLDRELHTLKGEAQLLGLAEVGQICGKLEELFAVARGRGYAVDDDFDLVVGMAVRFMAVLVRQRIGSRLDGIDVPAFVRQIDSLLAELRPEPRRIAVGTLQRLDIQPARASVPAALRARLAPFAVDAFIEYALARGQRRDRLRVTWHGLRDLLGIQRAMIGPAQLESHAVGGITLARELGKVVTFEIDLASIEATTELLAAVTTAVVHLFRNAIDHGIESPVERRRAGKPERATIRVTGAVRHERFELRVEDDGQGVRLERVHARAVELGLVKRDADIAQRWFDLVCRPGFSTRTAVTETSGRGVGLDAVRATITELGGAFTATSEPGRGTSWTLSIPLRRPTIDAHIFRVPDLPFPVAVDASWSVVEGPGPAPVLDLATELGFGSAGAHDTHHHFARGDAAFAIVLDREPLLGTARRLVVTDPHARADVVLVDGVEGLLLHR